MSELKSNAEMINELMRILSSMHVDAEYRKELEGAIKQLIEEDKLKNGNGGLA